MSEPTLGRGVADVWIVWAQESDRSGGPIFLAAYDGAHAKEQACALAAIIEKAGCYRSITASAVPLWPLISTKAGDATERPPGGMPGTQFVTPGQPA